MALVTNLFFRRRLPSATPCAHHRSARSERPSLSTMWSAMRASHVPDLSARDLAAALAVAEYRSFIAAAACLRTSQPALTRIIKRIEDVLGVRLFDRTTRRVEITAAGREFVAVAERMLNDLSISVRSMREIGEVARGQVIVATIMSVASSVLPRIAAVFRAKCPGVELNVREGVHGSVLEDVRSGFADLGITYVDEVPEFVTATPIRREVFDVILPRRHPLLRGTGRRPGLGMADIAAFPLVSLPSDSRTRRLIDAAASGAGVSLSHVVTVTQFATLMSFVRAGVGLAIVPSGSLVDLRSRSLAVVPLLRPRLTHHLGLIRLRDRELTPAAAAFAALLQQRWCRQLMQVSK
jgi:DNA-binding transcriptional LysR family regulator